MKASMRILAFLLLALLALGPAHSAQAKSDDPETAILRRTSKAFAAVAKKAMPAVVFIQVEKTFQTHGGYRQYNDPYGFFGDEFLQRFFGQRYEAPQRYRRAVGQGSGFLISKDGYILTNNHVVGDADRIVVKLHDGRELEARRVGSDPRSEVAVIKIDGDDYPCLELGDSDPLEIGEWVIAVGNPFGFTESLTVGVVSAKGRNNVGIAEYEDFIQTDAAINPGNSGGPLLNIDGEVIGINTAIFSPSGGYVGIGFAIPVNIAKSIRDQLMARGRVTRGFLGVGLNRENITREMADTFGMKEARGVLIADVVDGSPAQTAGLKEGDIILELNGAEMDDNGRFRNAIAMLGPGAEVKLKVFRDGTTRDVSATVGDRPGEGETDQRATALAGEIGLSVHDMTQDTARQLGYDLNEGVVVATVEYGSAAHRAEIAPGNLILSVNRRPVRNTAEFLAELDKAQRSKRILLRVRDANYSWFVLLGLE